MSENTTAEVAETVTEAAESSPAPNPTETVEFWRTKVREQEKRAKDNAAAAKRLSELEEASKSDAEKAADRVAKAEAEVASIPAKVAQALVAYWVQTEQIAADKAELYLTGSTPELVTKQFAGIVESDKRQRNHVPREGTNPKPETTSDIRDFTRDLFGKGE